MFFVSSFPHFVYTLKLYKDRIRAELNRHLKVEFDKRTSNELTQAVPPTETLNSDPAKERAGLARQGSLAERQPPAALVQKRQQINNDGFSTANDIPVVQVSHKNTDKLVKSKKKSHIFKKKRKSHIKKKKKNSKGLFH